MTLLALLRASHPEPSAVVAIVAAGLGTSAGLSGPRTVLLTLAVLAGQLSIGWSNDWLDAARGLDGARPDKPVEQGLVALATVRAAALGAAVVALVLSLALGVVPGLVHVLAVGVGWLYNVRLKGTVASVLAYVVAFGLLPSVASTAAGAGSAAWWASVTAAAFGAGVHFANVLPDLAADAASDVRGLPQRLGAARSVAATVVLLGAGTVTVLLGPAGSPAARTVVLAGVAIALLAAVVVTGVAGRYAVAYRAAMLTGLVVVGLLVTTDTAIV